MPTQPSEQAVYSNEYWTLLQSVEFHSIEYETQDRDTDGQQPHLSLDMTLHIDEAYLAPLVARKWDYLEATVGGVTLSQVVNEVARDIQNAYGIIFNRVNTEKPDSGLYKKTNSNQWKKQQTEVEYEKYESVLRSISDGSETIPTVPELYPKFLQKLSQPNTPDAPPEEIIEPLLKEHIQTLRFETEARSGVATAKRELETNGINPRTAASVAKELEPYLKPDSEIKE